MSCLILRLVRRTKASRECNKSNISLSHKHLEAHRIEFGMSFLSVEYSSLSDCLSVSVYMGTQNIMGQSA